MPRADLFSISRVTDPRPALRSTPITEAISENVTAMWAESNMVTLHNLEQRLLDEVENDYVQVTGKPVPARPPLMEEIVTEDKQVLPLTRRNWLFHQIGKLAPDEQRQIPTSDMVDQRFLAARDETLRRTAARLEEATSTGRVIGGLAGGLIAGVTDPFTIPFLPFGGFARAGLGAGRAMLRVGAIEAGIAGVTAIPGEAINANLERASGRVPSTQRALANVGLAALGGFAFGSLLEGGIRVGRRAFNRYRIKGLTREVEKLRSIEHEADAIALPMKQAGVRFAIPEERRTATNLFDEAIVALQNNDFPTARARVAGAHAVLGTTPDNFVARVKQTFDDPKVQKLIEDAEKAGQDAKRAFAKVETVTDEGGVDVKVESTTPRPSKPVSRETQVTKNAFERNTRTAERVRNINDALPAGARIERVRKKDGGFEYQVRTTTSEKPVKIPKIKSERSVATALRKAQAFGREVAQPEAPIRPAPNAPDPTTNNLDARNVASERYQEIEPEERVAAANRELEQRYAGREDEPLFIDTDADGNPVARSLNDLRRADAEDDFLAEEFKGCVTNG